MPMRRTKPWFCVVSSNKRSLPDLQKIWRVAIFTDGGFYELSHVETDAIHKTEDFTIEYLKDIWEKHRGEFVKRGKGNRTYLINRT